MISGECRVEPIGLTPGRQLTLEGLRLRLDLRIVPDAKGEGIAPAVWRVEEAHATTLRLGVPASIRHVAVLAGLGALTFALVVWFAGSRAPSDRLEGAPVPGPAAVTGAQGAAGAAPSSGLLASNQSASNQSASTGGRAPGSSPPVVLAPGAESTSGAPAVAPRVSLAPGATAAESSELEPARSASANAASPAPANSASPSSGGELGTAGAQREEASGQGIAGAGTAASPSASGLPGGPQPFHGSGAAGSGVAASGGPSSLVPSGTEHDSRVTLAGAPRPWAQSPTPRQALSPEQRAAIAKRDLQDLFNDTK